MIITVNSIPYTVLPFLANWNAQAPKWTLTWDTEIDQALRGYESRGAYRAHPRPRLSYAVDVDNAGEVMNLLRSAFRVDHDTAHVPGAADGTARFAVPHAGRESFVRTHTSDTLTIDPTPWPWAADDWLLVFGDDDGHVLAKVTGVAANVLTLGSLSASLGTLALGDGSVIAPLFLGRMDAPELDLQSPVHSDFTITVTGDRYEIAPGIPPACADEPEWPEPPGAVGPVAVASVEVSEMTASFTGTASTAGTHPKDGVTTVPLTGYEWDFGDGDTAVGATAEHEYFTGGVFTAVLTVRDGLRRFDTAVVTVTIEEPADDGSSGEVGGGGI